MADSQNMLLEKIEYQRKTEASIFCSLNICNQDAQDETFHIILCNNIPMQAMHPRQRNPISSITYKQCWKHKHMKISIP